MRPSPPLQLKHIHRTHMHRKRKYKLALIVPFRRLTKLHLQMWATLALRANPERKHDSATVVLHAIVATPSILPVVSNPSDDVPTWVMLPVLYTLLSLTFVGALVNRTITIRGKRYNSIKTDTRNLLFTQTISNINIFYIKITKSNKVLSIYQLSCYQSLKSTAQM